MGGVAGLLAAGPVIAESTPPGGGGGGGGGGCDPNYVAISITNVQVTIYTAYVTISWTQSPSGGSTTLYWGTSSAPYANSVTVSGSASYTEQLIYVNSDMSPGTTYEYTIIADGPAGNCNTQYLPGDYPGYLTTPWFSTLVSNYAWNIEDWSNDLGSNTITTGPTTSSPSGDTSLQVGSNAGGLGDAELESQMQYYGQAAAFLTATEVTATFYWDMAWEAEADGGLCGTGCASSYAWIHIAGNVYDIGTLTSSSGTWVEDGDVTQTIADEINYLGNPEVGSGNQYYSVSFSACFAADTYYQMFTYIQTETYAVGALADWAGASIALSAIGSLSLQQTGTC